jgi:hypothetical protein
VKPAFVLGENPIVTLGWTKDSSASWIDDAISILASEKTSVFTLKNPEALTSIRCLLNAFASHGDEARTTPKNQPEMIYEIETKWTEGQQIAAPMA